MLKYYIKKNLILFILLLLFSCSKQQKKQQSPPSQKEYEIFLIYGEADWCDLENADSITTKYGFKLKRIAGCDVGDIDLKATLLHNKKALKAMKKKYGENWMKKFEKETNYRLEIPLEQEILWQDTSYN